MFARSLALRCLLITALLLTQQLLPLTRLTRNDPYPLYTSADPYDFLDRCLRNDLEDYCEPCDHGPFRFDTSVFRQSATKGGDMSENQDAELGDLKGPWNVIGVFYDQNKRQELIDGLHLDTSPETMVSLCDTAFGVNLLTNPAGADPTKRFGFMSVPIIYDKYGARVLGQVALPCDFTLEIKGGLAHIFQEPTFNDLTCTATGLSCPVRDCLPCTGDNCTNSCNTPTCCTVIPETDPTGQTGDCINANCCIDVPSCGCKSMVIDRIIKRKAKLENILRLNIDMNLLSPAPFSRTGLEDTEINVHWSHLTPINKGRCDWPYFVMTPFATVGFTIPTGARVAPNNLFALPFGNNGHWSYGGRTGITFDFVDAFAIGGEVGFTGFTPRTFNNFPAPTNELQSGIFPELTTMRVQPGLNWDFAAYLGAYRFLDRFSAYVQYAVVNHDKDEFKVEKTEKGVKKDDILTRKLHAESGFRFHMINGALNYEISPCMMLGIVWQIPLFQQNAYRSTTVLATFQIFF